MAQPTRTRRPAEDVVNLVTEAVRVLDAADVTLLAALDGREYTLAEAAEYMLTMHGKARRLLDCAVVEAA